MTIEHLIDEQALAQRARMEAAKTHAAAGVVLDECFARERDATSALRVELERLCAEAAARLK
jgi:hypothetical protein